MDECRSTDRRRTNESERSPEFRGDLKKAKHAIQYDPSFTAGKKLTGQQREQYEQDLREESNAVEPAPERDRWCKPCCTKLRQPGDHRYCIPRHCDANSSRVAVAAALA